MCLSEFMVENSTYDSPRTNQGPMRRTHAHSCQHCLGIVHPQECNQRGVDANHIQSLANHLEDLNYIVSDKEEGCVAWRRPGPSTDPRSVDRGVIDGTAISYTL